MLKNKAAVALGRLGGLKGGKARMAALSSEEKSALGRKAAQKRWNKKGGYFTTSAKAVSDVDEHWQNKTAEERFLAVETIREATYALYNEGRKLPVLERVYQIVMSPPSEVHRHWRARSGGSRKASTHG